MVIEVGVSGGDFVAEVASDELLLDFFYKDGLLLKFGLQFLLERFGCKFLLPEAVLSVRDLSRNGKY